MAKCELDYNLQSHVSEETWAEYQRLTVVANKTPWSELPVTRTVFITGGVLTACLLVLTGITIGTGGSNVLPWLIAINIMLFLTLFVALFTVIWETRVARERALAQRDAIARTAELKALGGHRSYDSADPVPHYPVTGEYNPRLYMARGGPAMARELRDIGYGDWETYEANKPD